MYIETIYATIQGILKLILILYYGDPKERTSWKLYLFVLASVSFTALFILNMVPGSFYEVFLLYPLIFSIHFSLTLIFSVVYALYDQASLIIKNKCRGAVSPYTYIMIAIPNCLRTYTLILEGKDLKILVNYVYFV
jgi:hypothetical protein